MYRMQQICLNDFVVAEILVGLILFEVVVNEGRKDSEVSFVD